MLWSSDNDSVHFKNVNSSNGNTGSATNTSRRKLSNVPLINMFDSLDSIDDTQINVEEYEVTFAKNINNNLSKDIQ